MELRISSKTRRFTVALAAAGAAVAAGVTGLAPAEAGDRPGYGREQLQRDVDALRATGASGVLASVSTPKRQVAARSGVADLQTRRPVPWDAYHRIGSATKPFVATTTLQLVGEGRLSLDDTVERWLPGLVQGNGNDGSKVTVKQLLQHMSGIPDYLDDVPLEQATTPEAFRREQFRAYRPEQLVAMAMRHERLFEPGTKWSYSNTNYVLVEMVIEKVTGNPWQQEVHQRVIEPLGLRHTMLPGTSAYLPEPRLAASKRLGPDGPLIDVSTYVAGHADASIISTTGDVNRFFQALLGGRLLRPAQLKQMQDTKPAPALQELWQGAEYGLGLMKRKLDCGGWVWFHGGGGWNSITDNAVTPDGRRSAAVAVASLLGPGESPVPQMKSSAALIDNAFCATK